MTNTPTKGKFYLLKPDMNYAPKSGVVFENEQQLLTPPRVLLKAVAGGFPPLRETPRLVLDPAKGPAPRDLEAGFSGYWLMSERLHRVLSTVDPEAFAFVECEVRNADGSPGARYFLCDCVRTLDAVDEDHSELDIEVSDEFVDGKFYDMTAGAKLAFRKDVIGQAHAFHLPFSTHSFLIVDEVLHKAILEAGASDGLWFRDTADWSDA